jgi:hypothetical protein
VVIWREVAVRKAAGVFTGCSLRWQISAWGKVASLGLCRFRRE